MTVQVHAAEELAQMKPETLAIHAGQKYDSATGSVVMPIYQTAGYEFSDAAHAQNLFLLQDQGDKHPNVYTRVSNPTVTQFEQRMTALEGGLGAVAAASGMAAITMAVLNICRAGDNFVTSPNLYGGVSNLFKNILRDYGIEARFVDHADPENFRKAADEKTRLFWGETLPNPRLNVFPIAEVAAIANGLNIPLFIDNTCATPALCRPFEHGAHVVIHSATKYLCGHGSTIGGVVIDGGRFDWAANAERFPMLNEPDPSYHNMVWTQNFGSAAYIAKLRATMLRDIGACLAPFNAFLLTQGLETLHLRMQRHCENARKVAEFLNKHELVNHVNYPSMTEGTELDWSTRYTGGHFGPMVGVDIKGGVEAGQNFVESLKLFYHVANIGDVRSMAIHPASTTHSQVPPEQRVAGGITDGYVRLCIGIEHIDDIIADLEQAFTKL